MHAKRVRARVEKICEDHEECGRTTKARRVNAVFLGMFFPSRQQLVFGLPPHETIPSTPRSVRLSSDESANCATALPKLAVCPGHLIA